MRHQPTLESAGGALPGLAPLTATAYLRELGLTDQVMRRECRSKFGQSFYWTGRDSAEVGYYIDSRVGETYHVERRCPQQPPLAQGGDPVDGGQQAAGILAAAGRGLLVAPLVGVAPAGQAVVADPADGDDAAARLDVAGHERAEKGARPARLSGTGRCLSARRSRPRCR